MKRKEQFVLIVGMNLSQNKPILKLDWATHESAKYAVEHWHYSKCMPSFQTVKVGVWEDKKFIGVVIFSKGANCNIHKPYKLNQTEVCELTRVTLTKHFYPVSKILSMAIKMLKKQAPNLKLIVSYADLDQNHTGSIYQANNWIYTGTTSENARTGYIIKGRKTHNKTVHSRGVIQSLEEVRKHLDPEAMPYVTKGKHKYLFILDERLKPQILPLAKPYPKSLCVESSKSEQRTIQSEGGGELPTSTLHISKVSNA